MPVRLAVVPLTGCGGCEMRLADILARRSELLEGIEVVYWPLVHSARELPERVDAAILVGTVATERDAKLVREARKRARILIALGTCAVFGGVSSQADYMVKKKLVEELYGQLRGVPGLVRTRGVTELVEVDAAIPRCPPPEDLVEPVLEALVRGQRPVPPVRDSVCSECPRMMEPLEGVDPEKHFRPGLPKPGEVDPNRCLLVQGYLCLGPVTSGGCGAACPRAGLPCFGCGGPVSLIVERPDLDIPTALATVIAGLFGLDPAKHTTRILRTLVRTYGLRRFYVFTLSSRQLLAKPRGYARRLMAERRVGRRLAERV